ncbi:MAG: hypothetical protein WBN75_01910 [Verrucomicrobiia bacterium]|jgi:hypothetical protein
MTAAQRLSVAPPVWFCGIPGTIRVVVWKRVAPTNGANVYHTSDWVVTNLG